MTKQRGGRADYNSPFYIAMRDAERRILRETLEHVDFNEAEAARMLGISHTLVWQRARVLGGVHRDQPRREPFNYQDALAEAKETKRAKRRNKHLATGNSRPGESETTAPSNGATDGVHDEQDRTASEPVTVES